MNSNGFIYCQHPCRIGLKGPNFVGSFEDLVRKPAILGGEVVDKIWNVTEFGIPLYKPYWYELPQRIWFLICFGLKTGIDFFESRNYCVQ